MGGAFPIAGGQLISYGDTTDIYGCHLPAYGDDDETLYNCGDIGRGFIDPQFHTVGFMWCYESPGTHCEPSFFERLDVVYTG